MHQFCSAHNDYLSCKKKKKKNKMILINKKYELKEFARKYFNVFGCYKMFEI